MNSYIPLITPRDPKDRGTKAAIDGAFNPGDKIVLVDDLITKADTKLEKIKVLEAAGLEVVHVLVVVDREQGGADEIEKAGYQFHSLFKFSEMLEFYREEKLISNEVYQEIKDYLSK